MEYIPPDKRYSQQSTKQQFDNELIGEFCSNQFPDSKQVNVSLLSGGFSNANFLVETDDEKQVLRIYTREDVTPDREASMLAKLHEHGVDAPLFYDHVNVEDYRASFIEYCEGSTLEELLLKDKNQPREMFYKVGEALAKIHSINFDLNGFIDEHGNPDRSYETFGPFALGYIKHVFNSVGNEKLPSDLKQKALELLDAKWHLVVETEPRHQLMHCDFNPKNLIVEPSGNIVTLDWEFCSAGNGLIDIGNFFRFEYDYPEYAREEFEKGYRSVLELPDNYSEVAKLCDLTNVASFLERQEEYPETFHTARTILESTMVFFATR